ncbi:hypothetical protein B0J11DRAFT_517827 [Dendryphion nanum]|uniref:TPR domain protein n=1 Tax=Dendryphion nanum TaxID=256645 RepID=A0A9P9ED23_9PLEO|nr:hypothetical protein B0J11DRAFT_517827 [Dendryphion nanum]
MFSRALPRAVPRVSHFAKCNGPSNTQAFTRIPLRTWRPVQLQYSRREQSNISRAFKENYKRSPIMFPLAVGSLVVLITFASIWIPLYYQNAIIKPYHNFPEPVAQKLRRAFFYSRGKNLDLHEANKYFRQALAVAQEVGMDPFGPEILGVKYAIMGTFEKAGQYPLACDVLEIMRVDCQRWIDEFSDNHWTNGNRSRILKVIVQLNVKLGELYDTKYMNQPDDAEKRLVEAVEIVLRESTRREKDGVKEGEGDFMTAEEIGGTMESLAHHYEQYDSHYLATPLFLQALAMCPPNSCHGVVLMNNISTCLAQQTPPTSSPSPTTTPSVDNLTSPLPAARAALVDQARKWADNAIARAVEIKSPDRNEECDVGCAVATHNLGEFLEMEGKIKDAQQKYKEAESLSKSIGFREGLTNAKAGLYRLKTLENGAK